MKFVSEITGKVYDTEKECIKAEKQFEEEKKAAELAELKRKEERAIRAKEIEDARAKVVEAEKHYRELVKAFTEDFDSYHISITQKNINDMFDEIFKFF